MKTRITLLFLALLAALVLQASLSRAQYFDDTMQLDINKFNITHLVHGDMWHNPVSRRIGCEFPKGSGKHLGVLASLWMTARDASGNQYTTGQIYRGWGVDYWPGPLDASGACTYATSAQWARIWKVSRADILAF